MSGTTGLDELDAVSREAACGCKLLRKRRAGEERIIVEPCSEEHADGFHALALAEGAEVQREGL